ncbi:MAG: AAA family ATPase [Clostridia bacterium]|jgi:adenylate kinase family enzyme|nr:AAA family ATPase [Clostridia bacterium]MDD3862466.1 AAA family ATPase [Clostridia bacterium]
MESYVINLYGAPGTGKSTLAAELFAELKKKNISTEITLEFAKELVYSEDKRLLCDQLIVLAEQYRRIFVLNKKVDFIITDSPVLLSIFYNRRNGSYHDPFFTEIALQAHEKFNNINFLLERDFGYNSQGRNENEQEAEVIQSGIKNFFQQKKIDFIQIEPYNAIEQIMKHIKYISKKRNFDFLAQNIKQISLPVATEIN